MSKSKKNRNIVLLHETFSSFFFILRSYMTKTQGGHRSEQPEEG